MSDYNPNSIDAVLARIEARQIENSAIIREVRDEAKKTNGRITKLERDKWYVRGVTATIAIFAGGAWEYLKSRANG